MKIIIADGLKEVDKEALDYCLAVEGDIYYHARAEGMKHRLLFDLLRLNEKCNVKEVDDEELFLLLKGDEIDDVRTFSEEKKKEANNYLAVGVIAGLIVFVTGVIVGKTSSR